MQKSIHVSSKMIWSDELPTSKQEHLIPKSSPILPAVSISNAKGVELFWNEVCKAISSWLWLPTATDWRGSTLTSSNNLSSATLSKSWFSANLLTPVQPTNFYKTCSLSLASLRPECTALANTVTKSRKIRL